MSILRTFISRASSSSLSALNSKCVERACSFPCGRYFCNLNNGGNELDKYRASDDFSTKIRVPDCYLRFEYLKEFKGGEKELDSLRQLEIEMSDRINRYPGRLCVSYVTCYDRLLALMKEYELKSS